MSKTVNGIRYSDDMKKVEGVESKDITEAVIADGVTEIGYIAFKDCASLASVTIPEGVTEIGWGAFFGCNSLKEITFGGTAAQWTVGLGGFIAVNENVAAHCSDGDAKPIGKTITEFAIPDGVTKICKSAFEGCASLASVAIPEGVTEIGEYAFKGCAIEELTHPCLTIRGGVAVQDEKAQYCANAKATEITIPEGATKIGKYAFSGCTSLASVTIPASITEIGEGAFWRCASLKKVILADALKKVNSKWFRDLPEDYEIVCAEGSDALKAVRRSSVLKAHVKSLALEAAKSAKVSEIQKVGADAALMAIAEKTGDAELKILNQTKSALLVLARSGNSSILLRLSPDATKWMKGLEEFMPVLADSTKGGEEVLAAAKAKLTPAEIPANLKPEWKCGADGSARLFCAGVFRGNVAKETKSLSLFGMTEIGEWAFKGCASLALVTIPKGVTGIGNNAFRDCKSLASVAIPEGVTGIDGAAFKGCASLASVTIPESVKEIGDRAFKGCAIGELTHPCLTIMGGVAVQDEKAQYCANAKATEITIPEGVTRIGWGAFEDCASLASVAIPEGVTEIDGAAFKGCTSLNEITFGGTRGKWTVELLGFKSLPEGTIVHCSDGDAVNPKNATEFVIPEGATKIGKYAFSGCTSLASVTIPEGVTEIGGSAFSGCKSLASVAIPEGVTEIGGRAFEGCASLASVAIPEGVTEIGGRAFSGCASLASVTIPEGVTEIGEEAFEGCASLRKVILADTFKKVDSGWFKDLPEDYEIFCAEGSDTFKAARRSSILKAHLRPLAGGAAAD